MPIDGEARLEADGDEDKVWGMPKYEHNHLGNLTDEEYLAAVSSLVLFCFSFVSTFKNNSFC
jgi:hypothetical protein